MCSARSVPTTLIYALLVGLQGAALRSRPVPTQLYTQEENITESLISAGIIQLLENYNCFDFSNKTYSLVTWQVGLLQIS